MGATSQGGAGGIYVGGGSSRDAGWSPWGSAGGIGTGKPKSAAPTAAPIAAAPSLEALAMPSMPMPAAGGGGGDATPTSSTPPPPAASPTPGMIPSPAPTDEAQPIEGPDALRQGIGQRIPPSLAALFQPKVY